MDSKKLRVSALADAHSKEFDAMLLRHKNGIKSLQQRHAAEITNMKERQKRQIEKLQKSNQARAELQSIEATKH